MFGDAIDARYFLRRVDLPEVALVVIDSEGVNFASFRRGDGAYRRRIKPAGK